MKKYDAIVIGGGPIGSYTAGKISKKGHSVAVLEKNKKTGQNLNCAGLVTQRVLDLANVSNKKIIQNKIKGANIHTPSKNILKIGGDKTHAIVINRIKFDKELAKEAEKNNVDFLLGNNVKKIDKVKNTVNIKTSNRKSFSCKVLIGADGPHSMTRKHFNLPEPKEFLTGVGAEVTNCCVDSNFVEIFVGTNLAPGFFAWMIPTNEDGTKARVGLCTSRESLEPSTYFFKSFMKSKRTEPFLKNARVTRKIGGIIPLGVLKKTFEDNVLIVGDAASQVKPTSGGGLYPGLASAEYCSHVVVEALKKYNYSANFLKNYHKLWTKHIGKELSKGMAFRSIFRRLTDDQFDKYISKFQDPKLLDIINNYGDIDFPSKLSGPILKKAPSLLKLGPSVIKNKRLF